jgi:hypothetical protein
MHVAYMWQMHGLERQAEVCKVILDVCFPRPARLAGRAYDDVLKLFTSGKKRDPDMSRRYSREPA